MKRLIGIVAVLLIPLPLAAWGEKGHSLSSEAATFGLPNDMPPFFYRHYAELTFLGYDPDRWRGAGESLDAANPPNHFLDYEFVAGLQLPPDRYKFIALLYDSGTLRRHGITDSDSGFLPWAIAELSDQLTSEFRQWRFAKPPERAYIERDIIHVAGILGHYAADAANPHHTTIDYNGWVEPNPNHYATDCDTHFRFETQFVSHAVELNDVTTRLAAPQLRTDYFASAVEFIRSSNALVGRLYQIDRAGGFDIFRPPSREARFFAADRLAAGASMLRDLWWSAWRNSGKPPRRRAPAPD